jgi:hypothetical protein
MYKITKYLPYILTKFHDFSVYLILGIYVPNWSISRNYKKILNSTKISVTLGVYLTRGGSVQRPLTSGPRGWPTGQTPLPASPTLQPLAGWLHGDKLQEAVEGNPQLKEGAGRTPSQPTTWLGRPATTWRVTDLTKSVTPPWTPINTSYRWK